MHGHPLVEHFDGKLLNLAVDDVQRGAAQVEVVANCFTDKPANHAFGDEVTVIFTLEIFDITQGLRAGLEANRLPRLLDFVAISAAGFLISRRLCREGPPHTAHPNHSLNHGGVV